jgi:hypothetical protein
MPFQCVMPPVLKQSKAVFVLFDDNEVIELRSHVHNKNKSVMVSTEDWI